jgi:phosphopantetheinyl transferase
VITYKKKGKKYIICKEGVYFSLTISQVSGLMEILKVINNQ